MLEEHRQVGTYNQALVVGRGIYRPTQVFNCFTLMDIYFEPFTIHMVSFFYVRSSLIFQLSLSLVLACTLLLALLAAASRNANPLVADQAPRRHIYSYKMRFFVALDSSCQLLLCFFFLYAKKNPSLSKSLRYET